MLELLRKSARWALDHDTHDAIPRGANAAKGAAMTNEEILDRFATLVAVVGVDGILRLASGECEIRSDVSRDQPKAAVVTWRALADRLTLLAREVEPFLREEGQPHGGGRFHNGDDEL